MYSEAKERMYYLLNNLDRVSGKEFENIIKSSRDYINYSDTDGCTALMHACKIGYFWQVEILLKEGADVNKQNKNEYNRNALEITESELRRLLEYYEFDSIYDEKNIFLK